MPNSLLYSVVAFRLPFFLQLVEHLSVSPFEPINLATFEAVAESAKEEENPH